MSSSKSIITARATAFAPHPHVAGTVASITDEAAVRRMSRRSCLHDDADAWHALGAALLNLGDRAGAFAAFRNALRLDGTHLHSQLALGNLLFDSGQCERALNCFGMSETA